MGEITLFDLPREILCDIASHLSPNNISNLRLTCSYWNDIIKRHILHILKLGPDVRQFERKTDYKIYPEQLLLLTALKKSKHIWNFLEAPMGSGKTAIMLNLALQTQGRTLIIINTRIYTSWIAELKNFGFKLHQNPEKSDIFVVHTKYPKHRDLVLYGKTEKIPKRIKLIVTTFHYILKSKKLSQWVSMTPGALTGKVIVDEAHLINYKQFYNLYMIFNVRYYWFSASPLEFSPIILSEIGKPFYYKAKNTVGGYPKLHITRKSASGNFSRLVKAVIKGTKYTHIVVFSSWTTSKLRSEAFYLKDRLEDYKVLVFNNTAPTILERWKRAEKSVLLCNYFTASEGVNFSQTDCAIFFGFDRIGLEKARQSFGRIRRKNSVHKDIQVYFMESQDPVTYVRSMINHEYAINLKMKDFKKKTRDKMALILALIPKDAHELSGEDVLRIFTYDHAEKPDIKVEKLTLPLEDILTYTQL